MTNLVTRKDEVRAESAQIASPGRVNCLFLTHRFPYPPNRGDRIRAYQILRFLNQRSNVWLACTTDQVPLDREIEHVRDLCTGGLSINYINKKERLYKSTISLLRGRSATEGAFHCRSMNETVRNWSSNNKLHAAVIYCSSMGSYLSSLACRPDNVVLDLVDLDSQKWRDYASRSSAIKKWLYNLEAERVHKLENRLVAFSNHTVLVSPQEVKVFHHHHTNSYAETVGNGVDTEFFSPDKGDGQSPPVYSPRIPRFTFVGVLNYHPNSTGITWFCKNVRPGIRRYFPNAQLDIVGRSPTKQIKSLDRLKGINVVGPVDDVRSHLRQADVSIAPLHIARGIQNKVLESLAIAKPVIATPQAAWGISPCPGLEVADTKDQWIATARKLLDDRPQLAILGQSARMHVEQMYSWPERLRPLEKMLGLTSASTSQTKRGAIRDR